MVGQGTASECGPRAAVAMGTTEIATKAATKNADMNQASEQNDMRPGSEVSGGLMEQFGHGCDWQLGISGDLWIAAQFSSWGKPGSSFHALPYTLAATGLGR